MEALRINQSVHVRYEFLKLGAVATHLRSLKTGEDRLGQEGDFKDEVANRDYQTLQAR